MKFKRVCQFMLLFYLLWQSAVSEGGAAQEKGASIAHSLVHAQGEGLEKVNTVEATGSTYKTVSVKSTGWFQAGQDADIILAAPGFNNAGGPLLFNHPGNVASDGAHLVLADRNNNRVLIWNTLPTDNTPPDLVLGQKDFSTNGPGAGLDQLNWPVGVAAAGGKAIVADTYNDRILIWHSFPSSNAKPADVELKGARGGPGRGQVVWPWAVWSDGQKLVVASTGAAQVLIWNQIPAQDSQAPDIVLALKDHFGTPRSIASDGKHLMIGDHNAKPSGGGGNFFWRTFPVRDDQMYDFFVSDLFRMGEKRKQGEGRDVLWAGMSLDGKLIGISNMLYLWNSFPENEEDAADLKVGGVPGQPGYDFGGRQAGDSSGIAFAGGKVYISLSNGNKIVGFNAMPAAAGQAPDFAVGAPDVNTQTLLSNYFISNPVPATNGKSLFVASGFDGTLSVWKNLPDESGVKPDYRYQLEFPPSDIALFGDTLVLAERFGNIYVWKKLPLAGELPDASFQARIGGADLAPVGGIALDGRYFYLAVAEGDAGKIYVWDGVPGPNVDPKFSFGVERAPSRLSSDGNYLAVLTTEPGSLTIFRVSELGPKAQGIVIGERPFNLPQGVFAGEGHLFVADTCFNRVHIWKDIEDAIGGKEADVLLGYTDRASRPEDAKPEIGRHKLFWPAGLCFDGSFLWVGEFKFSGRVLRFSVRPAE
ncbi:MAG: hypothetical protein HYY14_06930 [Candidatus Omnitrophica bacterium]|nr:hypothetical protein [Candidatus Omnitrophota bacterium]